MRFVPAQLLYLSAGGVPTCGRTHQRNVDAVNLTALDEEIKSRNEIQLLALACLPYKFNHLNKIKKKIVTSVATVVCV